MMGGMVWLEDSVRVSSRPRRVASWRTHSQRLKSAGWSWHPSCLSHPGSAIAPIVETAGTGCLETKWKEHLAPLSVVGHSIQQVSRAST